MKIGIMGGTFDPIHKGHLMLAEKAYQQFQLDEVWFLPNGHPPHKQSECIHTDASQRVDMVKLAIVKYPEFKLEAYEALQEKVSYSYKTMEYFKSIYPLHQFYFIIGADSLFAIETWAKPCRILAACIILAAYRDNIDTRDEMSAQIDYLKNKYQAKIDLLATQRLDISSSEIRRRIGCKESITQMVPKAVEAYIQRNNLYGKESYESCDK